ncbi:uncharacterized protein JCM6883_001568 [Sporobolomyces salmoneus]|uniref:uncharacterized protein n=1 Tax=Sporobolomyces salmoneus TaxID=183962 RepID=UPI003178B537
MNDSLTSSSAATPSRSPPSSDCFPLLRLPPELVQLIIESSVPLQFHSLTYVSRQSTLRRLCLVSKLFYEITKPLLFAVVRSHSDKLSEIWSQAEAGGGGMVRELLIQQRGLGLLSFEIDLRQYSSLRLLAIGCNFGVIDFAKLACLPNLIALRLSDATLRFSTPFVLGQLRELELYCPHLIEDHILNPASLPSLRLLAYSQDNTEHTHIVTQALTSLAPRLDVISLDLGFAQNLQPTLLKQLNLITLWDLDFDIADEEPVIPVSYLRVVHYSSIDQIIDLLASTPDLRPTLLYLAPEVFNRKVTLEHRHELMMDFGTMCGNLGIEIIYEDQGKEWFLDGGLSKDFRARMERKRMENGAAK